MVNPNYESEYREFHLERIKHLIRLLRGYLVPGYKIGIVGWSIFDDMIRSEFAYCEMYNIVSEEVVKKQEMTSLIPNRTVFYDITGFKGNSSENFMFDGIIFTEVLEHLLADDSLVLFRISKLLKNDGMLFFSVPNVSALGKLSMLVLGKNPYMNKKQILDGAFGGFGHIREYSFEETKKMLSQYFDIIKLRGLNDYPTFYNKLAKFLPYIYSETIFAICRKRTPSS
jgi:hypothetical protein